MDRNYQVSVLAPPAWPFVEIFLEIAELLRLSLESAGYPARLTLNELSPSATNIIVGYNFFAEAPPLSGYDCIVYQLEQLNQRDDRFNTEWMDRLRRARLIWDYSSQNIAFLKSHGFDNVRHVPVGYHPALQRIPPQAEKDIDVLLYGSINERRRHVMRQLRERCRVEMAFRVYGEQRDELIARSKIVLNVHLHEGAIFEQARAGLPDGRAIMKLRTASTMHSYRAGSAGGAGEDRVEIFAQGAGCVIALADGMGGRAGGAAAADAWIEFVRQRHAAIGDPLDPQRWRELLIAADLSIRDDRDAGETTAVVVAVTEGGITGASVGDSGAWIVLHDRHLDLTAAQVRKPGLGTGMARPMLFRSGPLADGTLLIASDGLWKYTTPARICEIVRRTGIDSLPEALVNLVRMPAGGLQDDIAVAVARWDVQ